MLSKIHIEGDIISCLNHKMHGNKFQQWLEAVFFKFNCFKLKINRLDCIFENIAIENVIPRLKTQFFNSNRHETYIT